MGLQIKLKFNWDTLWSSYSIKWLLILNYHTNHGVEPCVTYSQGKPIPF